WARARASSAAGSSRPVSFALRGGLERSEETELGGIGWTDLGRRGQSRGLPQLGARRLADQDLLEAARVGVGRHFGIEEEPAVLARHLRDAPDRQSLREHAVESRSDDAIADPHVVAALDVLEGRALLEETAHDPAHARPLDQDVDAAVRIGEED